MHHVRTRIHSLSALRATSHGWSKSCAHALQHPNVCRLVGGYQCEHNIYYVTELVEGGELSDVLDGCGGKFPVGTAGNRVALRLPFRQAPRPRPIA